MDERSKRKSAKMMRKMRRRCVGVVDNILDDFLLRLQHKGTCEEELFDSGGCAMRDDATFHAARD